MNGPVNVDFSVLTEAVDEFQAELKGHADALRELRVQLAELRGIRTLSEKKSNPLSDKAEFEPLAQTSTRRAGIWLLKASNQE